MSRSSSASIVLASAIGFGLFACGHDDDASGSTAAADLLGSWGQTTVNNNITSDVFLVFNANGTHKRVDRTATGGFSSSLCGAGTYTLVNGTLTLTTTYTQAMSSSGATTTSMSTDSFMASVSGDTLRLGDMNVYQRMTVPGDTGCAL